MMVCRPGVYYSMIRSHLECNGHSIQSCKSMVWKKTVLVTIRVSVRVVARPGSQLLGINGRDDGSVVLSLVPKEEEGECFQDALARVCRCIGGGAATENADSDSDLEVVADSVTVNLRCPVSENWQCPICLKNYSLENVIVDPYFNRITSMVGFPGAVFCYI
ncbi:hypothetical protein BHE74_00023894 [Ensete ventricosum]|nr:hypothetical protein GW17_00041743 [Ensete ventricosum]RWW68575.1 hypothetical protein BHE74_00023894 [Ensete ventricosum]RZR98118.1 hypothetical protein BHM03_00027428 [Ensete ventricosum]